MLKNKKFFSISLISSMLLVSNANALSLTSFFGKKIDNTNYSKTTYEDNILLNLPPDNLFRIVYENGIPVNEKLPDTEDLKLYPSRAYFYKNKKALLIKVVNKTNHAVNVAAEFPSAYILNPILPPFGITYMIISNFSPKKPYKYEITSYSDTVAKILSRYSFKRLLIYFNDNPIILKLSIKDNKLYPISYPDFKVNFLGKGNMKIFYRIDRIIDEVTNRYGMYIAGFLKVDYKANLYRPYSFYFVMDKGKIVKVIYIDKLLTFPEFKNAIYRTNLPQD